MRAIFKKEIMTYFHSVLGYFFIAAIWFVFAIYALAYNLRFGSPYVGLTVSAIPALFFVAIPFLTMKTLSDEKRNRTDQLLMTSPVSVYKIVIGKFLGVTFVFIIPTVLILLYSLYLNMFGSISMIDTAVALLAYALYGMACIAVGIYISSLTEKSILAAAITFVIIFCTYMMDGLKSLVSANENLITKVMDIFDAAKRFDMLVSIEYDATGNIYSTSSFDLSAVIYFISIIFVMLFLTVWRIKRKRVTFSIKNYAFNIGGVSFAVFIIALVVFANMFIVKIPENYRIVKFDNKELYGISQQTKNVLNSLGYDIKIYVLSKEENVDNTLNNTLKEYKSMSDKISVEYIDITKNTNFAEKYTNQTLSEGSLIIESEKRFKVIPFSSIYEFEYDYSTYTQNITGYDGEGQITSAIDYCVRDNMPKVYIIAGHNEYELNTGFTGILEKENIDYSTISLMNYDEIPEDAKCVIINAPETDFSKDDSEKVINYLNKGGKVIITTEFVQNSLTNFENIISDFGMTIKHGCIADNTFDNYYQSQIYLLPDINYADETMDIAGEYSYIMAPLAQAITVPENEVENMTYTRLLTTSDKAVLKSGKNQIKTFEKEEGDEEGSFCIGVKAQKEIAEDTYGTLYVFGSAQMFTDDIDAYVSGNNKKLFKNIVKITSDISESISIPVKSYSIPKLMVAESNIHLFIVVAIIVIPLTIILTGMIVWLRRRKL